ncbi:RICIN domain-containing protein [Amycolatopsis sp. NPDC048633]|uniref:RICIN domain-containing protein n=1 Tax=Amycolatopsis sp. NPDC048633 TaxID=3157095 RepID=UPI0033C50122
MSARRFMVITAVALTLAGLTSTPANAVAGGEGVPAGADRFAVRITGGGTACSGALVAPQWVVTAASCVPSADQATVTAGTETRHVTRVVPRTDRDLALVQLTYPVTGVTPLRVGTAAPAPGESLKTEGFGRTTTEWVPDRLTATAVTVGAATATTVALTSPAGTDPCKGDAGGPVLRESAGPAELAAIAVTSWQHGCLDSTETRQGSTAVRVDDLAAWIIQQLQPPVFRLTNRVTQRCLTVQGTGNDSGSYQFDCPSSTANQSWALEPVDGGGVLVRNQGTNRCLIVHSDGSGNGTPAIQFECLPQFADQLWDLTPVDGGMQLRNRVTGRCLAVQSSNNVNGAPAYQFDCEAAYTDQIWDLTGVPEPVQVHNRATQRCLAVHGSNNVNDAPAFQFDCTPAYADQAWEVEPNAAGGFLVRNQYTKRCLIVHAGEGAAGFAKQFDCLPQFADQLWDLNPAKGGVQLRNRGSGFCLLIAGDNVNDTGPAQADCATAGTNSVWDIARFPAATPASAAPAWTAADGQPSLVEDFGYPGAAKVLADYQVQLVSGDGHILFADCATPRTGDVGLMRVRSTENVGMNHDGLVCFQVKGTPGDLVLRIPAVYEIRGDGYAPGAGHAVTAQVTTDAGVQSTVDVNPRGSTQVGIGASPNNAPTTLLRLTAGY